MASSKEESGELDKSDDDENSDDDLVVADLYEQSTVLMPVLTFEPHEQIAAVRRYKHTLNKEE